MKEHTDYAMANAHLNTATGLLERAQTHLERAKGAGADLELEMAKIDSLLRLVRIERETIKTTLLNEIEKEISDESKSTI